MGSMRELIEATVVNKGTTSVIRKSIIDGMMKLVEFQNVYVIVSFSTGGKAQTVSGSIVRMISFIQDQSPPAESVEVVGFSTDRNWARGRADEI